MRGKAFTNLDLALIKDMFHRGATIQDIAKRLGRTSSSIRTRLNIMGLHISERDANHKPEEKVAEPKPVEKKLTLNDFSPRDMIKHLYDKGYRIINGKLYQVTKIEIKLSDIVA